jgi:PIN domain nuclease of toxin-antitoxin system
VRLLLDTHVLLWWATADRRLSKIARMMIASDNNEVAASVATFWEIAIKANLGRIDVDVAELHDATVADGFETISVRVDHTFALAALPNHHRDPFDRLLIAQAITESWRLVTADEDILAYADVPGFDPVSV